MTVDCDIASAHGGDPVFADDQQVGSVTSAGYGHRVAKNIAYAYVNPDCSRGSVPGSVSASWAINTMRLWWNRFSMIPKTSWYEHERFCQTKAAQRW